MPGPTLEPLQTALGGTVIGDAVAGGKNKEAVISGSATTSVLIPFKRTLRSAQWLRLPGWDDLVTSSPARAATLGRMATRELARELAVGVAEVASSRVELPLHSTDCLVPLAA